jgi:hypothetical protein
VGLLAVARLEGAVVRPPPSRVAAAGRADHHGVGQGAGLGRDYLGFELYCKVIEREFVEAVPQDALAPRLL